MNVLWNISARFDRQAPFVTPITSSRTGLAQLAYLAGPVSPLQLSDFLLYQEEEKDRVRFDRPGCRARGS